MQQGAAAACAARVTPVCQPSHSLHITRPQPYVRAVLTGARPGLTAEPASAQGGSRLAAVRLAAYKAALSLLGPRSGEGEGEEGGTGDDGGSGLQLTEREAAVLVSVLDTELGSNTGSGDLAEVGAGRHVGAGHVSAPAVCSTAHAFSARLRLRRSPRPPCTRSRVMARWAAPL